FRFAKLWQASPTGMTGSFASGLIMGSVYGLGPLYAQMIGFDASRTAEFMGAMIIGGLMLQWPIGKISDLLDRRIVIAGVALASLVVSIGLVASGTSGGAGLLALIALFGGLSFTLYPLSVAYTNDHLGPEDLVPASGGLVMAYGIGAALGPLGGALVIEALGAGGLFVYNGAVSGLTLAFVLLRMRARASVPAAEQGAFTPMPRTSPVASELDPRMEGLERVKGIEPSS
ncbi:MAG: MFS transporter, partial [Planctomycetota bacterium]|nr:MFS transporter [Planctomycetota bacterium]